MKKTTILGIAILVLCVLLIACTQPRAVPLKTETAESGDTKNKMAENSEPNPETGYTGKVLAGKTSLYLDFNRADYEKALKENKKILLYFYANWCPLCVAEEPKTFSAFNELNDGDLVGFRVNYRDSDTDMNEEGLAEEYGVAYQHTKVLIKDGKKTGKYPDSWNKERYLEELKKL